MNSTVHARITITCPRMASGKSSFMECKACPACDKEDGKMFCHDKGERIWE